MIVSGQRSVRRRFDALGGSTRIVQQLERRAAVVSPLLESAATRLMSLPSLTERLGTELTQVTTLALLEHLVEQLAPDSTNPIAEESGEVSPLVLPRAAPRVRPVRESLQRPLGSHPTVSSQLERLLGGAQRSSSETATGETPPRRPQIAARAPRAGSVVAPLAPSRSAFEAAAAHTLVAPETAALSRDHADRLAALLSVYARDERGERALSTPSSRRAPHPVPRSPRQRRAREPLDAPRPGGADGAAAEAFADRVPSPTAAPLSAWPAASASRPQSSAAGLQGSATERPRALLRLLELASAAEAATARPVSSSVAADSSQAFLTGGALEREARVIPFGKPVPPSPTWTDEAFTTQLERLLRREALRHGIDLTGLEP